MVVLSAECVYFFLISRMCLYVYICMYVCMHVYIFTEPNPSLLLGI